MNDNEKENRDYDDCQDDCQLEFTDAEGNTNLCCCYAVDEQGDIIDPCDIPADECCC